MLFSYYFPPWINKIFLVSEDSISNHDWSGPLEWSAVNDTVSGQKWIDLEVGSVGKTSAARNLEKIWLPVF